MSTGACSASACLHIASQSSGRPTSATIVQARRPRSSTSAAVLARASASRATSTTSAPASAAARAISRPKPRLPPVIKSRLPSSRKRSSTLIPTPQCGPRPFLPEKDRPVRVVLQFVNPYGFDDGGPLPSLATRQIVSRLKNQEEGNMSARNEQEEIAYQAALRGLRRGAMDRREFLTRSLVTGLGLAGVASVAKNGIGPAFADDRPLTPTFYQWIQDLHPGIAAVNEKFPGINYQIAPVEGFGIERFVAEAKKGTSTWDVYVGQTPFVEMSAFIKAGVIEPWDNYIPKEVIDDIIPSIREECSIDGKLYSWPFFLDVCGSSWHSGITGKAGVADAVPATWDDFLDDAKKIVDSKAAPWG